MAEMAKQLVSAIKTVGGVKAAFWQLFRVGVLVPGRLVGKDAFGNEYYENTSRIFGRHRTVLYGNFWDSDSSQIPPEWHRWIHCMTDEVPTPDTIVKKSWQIEHYPNLTETTRAYVPYSTVGPKVEAWDPSAKP